MNNYPFGVQDQLSVVVCNDANEAIARGYKYDDPYKAVEITQAVVVLRGTAQGRSTVDFILQDQSGQKYVVMLTTALLKMLPD